MQKDLTIFAFLERSLDIMTQDMLILILFQETTQCTQCNEYILHPYKFGYKTENRSGAYSWPIVCLGILQVIYLSDSDRITILPIHFCVIYCSISPFSSIKPIQDRDTLDPISVVIRWRYTLYTVLQFQVTCSVTMDANQHLVGLFSDVLL